ncbi:Hypothetical predicted protein [Podarcis lilfordi]|uniref:Uncharacterized protein n=1 Tax=Podarcis lilfordi TaxID=74358 RepID=A0AA35PE31_9SAUR|nr:Hypothetical predicted protein [Podarcis lilfordi]
MHQKQLNLKFRGVEEEINENIKGKMIRELAKWLEIKEEEVACTVESAFRIRVKPQQLKLKKSPGDCLMIFNSIEMKNMILRTSYRKKLIIENRTIIIYKEIPIRLLGKRQGYRQIVSVLQRNNIQYRWEFPEGITFYYKDKRFRLIDTQEAEIFLRRYEKELGKGEEWYGGGGRYTERRKEKKVKNTEKQKRERKEEEEEVEEEGAVGGEEEEEEEEELGEEEEKEEETTRNRKTRS